jgi:hypothetical protein
MKTPMIILAAGTLVLGAAQFWRTPSGTEPQVDPMPLAKKSAPTEESTTAAANPSPAGMEAAVETTAAVQTPQLAPPQEKLPLTAKTTVMVTPTVLLPDPQPLAPAAVAPLLTPPPVVNPAQASLPTEVEYNGYASLELAQQMEGMERIQMVRQGISQIASVNVPRAVEAANSLADGHDHGVAVGSLVRIINEKNPALAASIAFSEVPPQTTLGLLQYPRTAVVMKQIMDTQISESPVRAVHWANSLPDAPNQEAARKLVAASWAERSPEAALQWVQTLPESNQDSVRAAIENAFTAPSLPSNQFPARTQ